MGFGFPAAIGVKRAMPEKVSINFTGDGSILMNVQELMTAVEYKLPVINVILNNNYLGMVRQWQQTFFEKRYSQTVMELPIDFIKLAEAYGATGLQTTKVDEVEATIKQALETPGPVLMNFKVSREENVLPMVPAGKAIHEMVLAS